VHRAVTFVIAWLSSFMYYVLVRARRLKYSDS